MAGNTFKVRNPSERKGTGVWSRIESVFNLDRWFEEGLPVKYLPPMMFVILIAIFYIGNNHYAERNIRAIDKLKQEVEDLKADYTTLKADLMYNSKQSEVAKRVKQMGLEESMIPPTKIEVEN